MIRSADFKCPKCNSITKDLPLIFTGSFGVCSGSVAVPHRYPCGQCALRGDLVYLVRLYTPPIVRGETVVKDQD